MAPYSPHLRNIPAREHRRCAVCTTWRSAVVFAQLLAGGERKEKAISWVAQGRVAGALRSLRLPTLLAWSGERRGEAAPGPRGQGGFEGPRLLPLPLLSPSSQPQFPAPLHILSPAPAEGAAAGKAKRCWQQEAEKKEVSFER